MKSIFRKIIIAILTFEAKFVIRKYKPKIISITGTVGKTSTKDAVYTAFSKLTSVRKSQKSFNSEIGIPLTILGLPNAWNSPLHWLTNILRGFLIILVNQKYPKWLILEVGADRPGDIKSVARWLPSDIVIITQLSSLPVHIEFFGSAEKLIEEKAYLINSLKDGGCLITNLDDDNSGLMRESFRGRNITVGFTKEADIHASYYRINYSKNQPVGISFKAECGDNVMPIRIKGILGEHLLYAPLFGLASIYSEKMNLVKAVDSLNESQTPNGRMRIIKAIKGAIIIDDTYNSSPIAVREALATLKSIKTKGRKIAVLGDMLELGSYSLEAHKEAGVHASESADIIISVGVRGRDIAESASSSGDFQDKVFQFDTREEAGAYLQDNIGSGDVILIKGSQSMRMEKIVEDIMAEPEKKERLLVRQEKEWGRR